MLNSISWSRFSLFISIGLICYYSYVLLRYYGRELRAFAKGKKSFGGTTAGSSSGGAAMPSPVDTGRAVVQAAGADAAADGAVVSGQPSLFAEKTPVETKSAELFKVMEKVVALLKELIAQAATLEAEQAELMPHVRELLSKYGHLKGTPYQVAIDNFLVRSCATNFSLKLTEEDLRALWP